MNINSNFAGAAKQPIQATGETNKTNNSSIPQGFFGVLSKIGSFVTGAQNKQAKNNLADFEKDKPKTGEKPIKFWSFNFNSQEIKSAANRMSEGVMAGQTPFITLEQFNARLELVELAKTKQLASAT